MIDFCVMRGARRLSWPRRCPLEPGNVTRPDRERKGQRIYDWARIRLLRLQRPPREHWLLIRRSRKDKADCAYYVVFAPSNTSLADLARVAGRRWTIEECFQSAKGEVGLDHCEARGWHVWHLQATFPMLAMPYLAALRAKAGSTVQSKRNKRSPIKAATRLSSRSLSRKFAR